METDCTLKWFRSARLVRTLIGAILAASMLSGCGAGVQVPPPETDTALHERQAQEFIEAMKPRRPGKPVIAIVALNEGTEITDFLLTHAVLQRAGVANVQAVALHRGPVQLYPALQVEVGQDFAEFDRQHPSGADYVIVPAMLEDSNPAVIAWLQRQVAQGARVIGVCAGALVLGRAGLLDGRRFVTHWYSRKTVLERHPEASYLPHRRYVIDRNVATTTGITASIPAMLALVEAIGGRERAQAVAAQLGVRSWTPVHDSTQFGLNASRGGTYLLNKAAFWRNQRWSVDVYDGMDDVSLALATDAWSRTGHVTVEAVSASGPVKLRSGLVLAAQPAEEEKSRLPLAAALKPVQQLDRTLCEIGERYGHALREWVMVELEYPAPILNCKH